MDKMILPYRGKAPVIDPTVFLAPMAAVIGDVTIGAGSSVWFGAVVRGDFQPITIGQNTNIQDNATIHVMRDVPVHIGNNVLIGHNAVVHCSRVGDNTLIGMGSLVFGNPAQIVRALRDDEIEALQEAAENYANLGVEYKRIVEELK